MPRKLRREYPDAIYHVMSRGDQREDIFLDASSAGNVPDGTGAQDSFYVLHRP